MAFDSIIARLAVNLSMDSTAFVTGMTKSVGKMNAAEREIRKLQRSMADSADNVAALGQRMSVGLTLPLTAMGVASFKAASDAAELQSAFDQTFGAMAGQMNAWAVETGDAMGRSTQALQQAANTFGIFFNQAAPTGAAAADLSRQFAVLAEDLASFYNVDATTAMEKLRSGLSGESEPLRDFGVFLTEAAVASKALSMGLADSSGAISEQAKIMARAQLIMEQTANAQGDVARTADGTANKMREVQAAFQELQVAIGTQLLPTLTPLIGALADLLSVFASMPTSVQTSVVALAALGVATGPVISGFAVLSRALIPIRVALATNAAQMAATAAAAGSAAAGTTALGASAAATAGSFRILSLALVAVPLGAVVVAVGAVAGAMSLLSSRQREARAETDALIGSLRGLAQARSADFAGARDQAQMARNAATERLSRLEAEIARFRGGAPSPRQRVLEQEAQRVRWELVRINGEVAAADRAYQKAGEAAKQMTVPIVQAGNAAVAAGRSGGAAIRNSLSAAMDDSRQKAIELKQLMDRLFPEAAARAQYGLDRQALISSGASEAALRALANERDLAMAQDRPVIDIQAEPLGKAMDGVGDQIERLTERAKVGTVQIARTFKDMANETVGALSRLSSAIQGGGFLSILESVIGLGLQLGSIGAFGKTIAGNINRPAGSGAANLLSGIPGYARGTNFHPGGLAMVGELRPELLHLPRGSRVTPNNELRGMGGIAEIVPSKYFDVVVDGRIVSASPAIMDGGAKVTASRMSRAQTRRVA